MVTLKLYTDFICPFCYIAESSTLERLQKEYAVTVEWRGFELHPDTPVGGMPLKVLFQGRDVAQMHAYVMQFAKTFGVDLPKPPEHLPNTRAALAAAEYARDHKALDTFRRAAQKAYWLDGKDLEAAATLRDVGKAAGLDPSAVVKASKDPVYLARVDAVRAESEAQGVTGIPTMVFPDGGAVVGCQPYEALVAAARRAGAKPRDR
jgi:predicted DsbA family dithiol-disulfide isomerase